jgi:uncharacterized membrane protein
VLAASTFDLIFRVFHIMFGIAWAGSAFLFTVFIEPAAAKLGPQAGPVMEELVERRKVGEVVTGIAAVTVIAGWILWFGDMQLFGFGDWIGSSFGIVLTIGGLAATGAFFAGLIGVPPNIKRLSALGKEVAASGGPPTPEQAAEMHQVQERMRKLSRLDLALIAIAVFCMATARYW